MPPHPPSVLRDLHRAPITYIYKYTCVHKYKQTAAAIIQLCQKEIA